MAGEEKQMDEVLGKEQFPITLNGKEYVASRLRMGDMGQFRAWIKKGQMKVVMQAAAEAGLDPKILSEQLELIRKSGLEKGEEGEDPEDPILKEIATEDGMRYLTWLSLRKNHPEVKLEDVNIPVAEVATLSAHINLVMARDEKVEEEEEGGEAGAPFDEPSPSQESEPLQPPS